MFTHRKNLRRNGFPQNYQSNGWPQYYGQQPMGPNYQQPIGPNFQQSPQFTMPNQMYNNVPYPTPYSAQHQYQTPYPLQQNQFAQNSKPSGVQSIMAQFKNKDGSYNVDKMMNTAGQMIGAVNQIGSMVQGFTKSFKA